MKVKKVSTSTITIFVFVLLCFIWLFTQPIQSEDKNQQNIQAAQKQKQEAPIEVVDFSKTTAIEAIEKQIDFQSKRKQTTMKEVTFSNAYKSNDKDNTSSNVGMQYFIFAIIIVIGIALVKAMATFVDREE